MRRGRADADQMLLPWKTAYAGESEYALLLVMPTKSEEPRGSISYETFLGQYRHAWTFIPSSARGISISSHHFHLCTVLTTYRP